MEWPLIRRRERFLSIEAFNEMGPIDCVLGECGAQNVKLLGAGA